MGVEIVVLPVRQPARTAALQQHRVAGARVGPVGDYAGRAADAGGVLDRLDEIADRVQRRRDPLAHVGDCSAFTVPGALVVALLATSWVVLTWARAARPPATATPTTVSPASPRSYTARWGRRSRTLSGIRADFRPPYAKTLFRMLAAEFEAACPGVDVQALLRCRALEVAAEDEEAA